MGRSQITIFLLLGLLSIIAFFFFFTVLRSDSEARGEVGIGKVAATLEVSTAVRQYIQSCLDEASGSALLLAASQSGYIYDFQAKGTASYYGPPQRPYGIYVLPFQSNEVAFGIYEPVYDSVRPDVPWYPYDYSLTRQPPVQNAFGNYKASSPTSVSSLPDLCYRNGSNEFSLQGFQWSCERYSNNPKSTVQYFLEQYILNKTCDCLDLSMFEEQGTSVTPTGKNNVSVMFGEDSIFVSFYYPVDVSTAGKRPVTAILSYTSTQPARFKKVYELADHIIRHNVRDVFFGFEDESIRNLWDCPGVSIVGGVMSRSLRNSKCLYDGMEVQVYRDVCLHSTMCESTADIVVIRDMEAVISGSVLSFMFAVQNRPPALDLIDSSVADDSEYSSYVTSAYGLGLRSLFADVTSTESNENYNIVSEVGKRIILIPFAADPDSDDVTFSYSGWKTPFAIRNSSGEEYRYAVQYSSGPVTREGSTVRGGSPEAVNLWEESQFYTAGFRPGDTLLHKDAEYPKNIGTLWPYLSSDDVGYHWVRINATDSKGSSDWQDIKIQVRCVPDANTCCDENADFHYKEPTAACGRCGRCSDTGTCAPYTGPATVQDNCGMCARCDNGACVADNSDPGGACALVGRQCMCGRCVPAWPPWYNPGKCSECYNQNHRCVGNQVVYDSVAGPCNGGAGTCTSTGVCVSSVPGAEQCYTGASVGAKCSSPSCGQCFSCRNVAGTHTCVPQSNTDCTIGATTGRCCSGTCYNIFSPPQCKIWAGACNTADPPFSNAIDGSPCHLGSCSAGICVLGMHTSGPIS